jgi:cytochrome b subunit of formate dehydrogenase
VRRWSERGWLARALLVLTALFAFAGAAGCGPSLHDDDDKTPPKRVKKTPEFYRKAVESSVHKGIDCTKCHTDPADKGDGDTPVERKSCEACHKDEYAAHIDSAHGKSLERGEKGAARCWDCHGSHEIVKSDDPRSPVYKLNLPYTCATCHQNTELAKQHGIKQPMAGKQFLESTHGRGLVNDGLIVAPSCTDCHGEGHKIYPAKDARSPIHYDNVPKTCGRCHVGVETTFEKSIHFKMLKEGKKSKDGKSPPVCSDCHSAHQIDTKAGGMKLLADQRCGKCHEDRLKHYRETYHGRAMALGETTVAACYDCHGHHDILPQVDPASTLNKKNLAKTCGKCHKNVTENFTGYQTHADEHDKEHYPVLYYTYYAMSGLLVGVGIFFLIHSVLWFARALALYLRDPEAFRQAKQHMAEEKAGKVFVRFRPVDRFCHFLVILSFLLLTTTGMPLKFYYAPWAQWMFRWMGGATMAAGLHRLGAILTFTYMIIHISSMAGLVRRNMPKMRNENGNLSIRKIIAFVFGPDSPVPNLQDVKDFWAHQKWFFGKGPRPEFDRWTYWEKFDYVAVFWGVIVIGFSGLIMWFPQVATFILPGWAINVAHLVHSDEAMLATGFIFTFHFFNVHFRLEKWPLDPVIFSGRITEAEMLHERKRQYDRLKAEGRLDDEKLGDEWARWKKIFAPIGMIAFTIGVVLIVAIYWVMTKRLLHG